MRQSTLFTVLKFALGVAVLSCVGGDSVAPPREAVRTAVPESTGLSLEAPVPGRLSSSIPLGPLSGAWPGEKTVSVGPRQSASAAVAGPQNGLLWQNTVTGERSIWLMNGPSLESAVLLPTVPTQWTVAGSGDFNADGNADIVWQNLTTGDRSIWFMNGNTWSGTFALLPTVPTAWSIAGVGDFNADGKPDLVWENTLTGDRSIWFMSGASYSSAALLPNVPITWKIAGVGDFNGDGKPDLVWQRTSTGESSIWYMNGATWSGNFALLPIVPTAWRIAAVATFDVDANPDIVWQNVASGERSIWLMNGATFSSAVILPTVPTQWSIAGVMVKPPALTGTIKVITVTTGPLPDPTGYTISVATGGRLAEVTDIETNSFRIFTRPPGTYLATLSAIEPNCITSDNPRNVTVTAGATTETTFNVACAAIGAPTNLAATATEAGTINLTWLDNSSNETGFKIEQCVGATCTNFAELGTVAANAIAEPITGVLAATTYRYRVRAYNATGNSEYSNIAGATGLPRKFKVINNMPEPNPPTIYDEVVRLKLAPNISSFGNADLLTPDDRADCQSLPGPSIPRTQSLTFAETIGNNYSIYMQIGAWEVIGFGFCPTLSPWSRTTAFPFTSGGPLKLVYTSFNITNHTSGTVEFTITGVFTAGTMRISASQGGVVFFSQPFTIANF